MAETTPKKPSENGLRAERQGSAAEAKPTAKKPDEDPVGKVYDSKLTGRLARYVRPYWLQATIASLAVSLKSICDATGPIMVMMAIDRYMAPNLKSKDATSAPLS
jgi:ATP-binding cassette, subfamily B, multidrug efflux pump